MTLICEVTFSNHISVKLSFTVECASERIWTVTCYVIQLGDVAEFCCIFRIILYSWVTRFDASYFSLPGDCTLPKGVLVETWSGSGAPANWRRPAGRPRTIWLMRASGPRTSELRLPGEKRRIETPGDVASHQYANTLDRSLPSRRRSQMLPYPWTVRTVDVKNVTVKIHRVSKKTKQICFCQNRVKFPPILIIFGRKMANDPNICQVH